MKKTKRVLTFCIVAALLISLVTGVAAVRRLLPHEEYHGIYEKLQNGRYV